MKQPAQRLLDGLLVAALLASILAIWWLARAPLAPRAAPGSGGAPFDLALPEVRPVKPASAYRAMVERPLFWAERRPQAVADGGEPARAGKLKDYTLVGAVIFDQRLIALVRDRKGKIQRLAKGAELDGWRLVELTRGEAVFEHAGERETLPLKAAKPAPRRRATVARRGVRRRNNRVRQPRQPMTRSMPPRVVPSPVTVTAPKPLKQEIH